MFAFDIDISPDSQKHFHHFRTGCFLYRPHQNTHTICVSNVGIRPGIQKSLHHVWQILLNCKHQCRHPLFAFDIDISPGSQKHFHHFRTGCFLYRPHQNTHTICVSNVGIRSILQQNLHHIWRIFLNRKHQCRYTIRISGVDIRPTVQELFHHFRTGLSFYRPHQNRSILYVFNGGICSILQQNMHYIWRILLNGKHQRRCSLIIFGINHPQFVRKPCQQLYYYRIGIVSRRIHQRRHTLLVFEIGISSGIQKHFHHFRTGTFRCPYQDRHTFRVFGVGICPILQQNLHYIWRIPINRKHQRRHTLFVFDIGICPSIQ